MKRTSFRKGFNETFSIINNLTTEKSLSIKETENKVETSTLPKAASEYLKQNMPDKKIKEVSKITFADKSVNYEADMGDMDIIFDSKGNFIKKEVDTEKD